MFLHKFKSHPPVSYLKSFTIWIGEEVNLDLVEFVMNISESAQIDMVTIAFILEPRFTTIPQTKNIYEFDNNSTITGQSNTKDLQNEYLGLIVKVSSISSSLTFENLKINGSLFYKIIEVSEKLWETGAIEFKSWQISEFDWITLDHKISYSLKTLKLTSTTLSISDLNEIAKEFSKTNLKHDLKEVVVEISMHEITKLAFKDFCWIVSFPNNE